MNPQQQQGLQNFLAQMSPEQQQQMNAAMAQMTPEMWTQLGAIGGAQGGAPQTQMMPPPMTMQTPGDDFAQLLQSSNGTLISSSFNNQFRDFLAGLYESFPERKALKLALDMLDMVIKDEPLKPCKGWETAMERLCKTTGVEAPYFSTRTPERVELLFKHWPSLSTTFKMVPIADMWNDPDFDDADRQGVWEHLYQLELLATALGQFNPQQINAMEKLAKNFVTTKMQGQQQPISMQQLAVDVIKHIQGDEELKRALGGDDASFSAEGLTEMLNSPMGSMIMGMMGNGGIDPAALMGALNQ